MKFENRCLYYFKVVNQTEFWGDIESLQEKKANQEGLAF